MRCAKECIRQASTIEIGIVKQKVLLYAIELLLVLMPLKAKYVSNQDKSFSFQIF